MRKIIDFIDFEFVDDIIPYIKSRKNKYLAGFTLDADLETNFHAIKGLIRITLKTHHALIYHKVYHG